MPHRTTVKVLVFDPSEEMTFDEFKKICRKYSGSYVNFSLPSSPVVKRFGFVFKNDFDFNAAFEEIQERLK